jgi:hypothetical protein
MKKLAAVITMFLMPTMALAQYNTSSGSAQNATGLLATVYSIVTQLTYIIVAVGILVFIYGVVMYVIAGSEDKKEHAQRIILWGVIGLFAIVAVWGLVAFLANTTGVGSNTGSGNLPCPPGIPAGTLDPNTGLPIC